MTTDLTSAKSSTSHLALSSDGTALPIRWVESLFARMTAIVGSSMFMTVYAGVDVQTVKQQWAEALASFSPDEISRGLAATRTRKFPPNLPEFLHLCRPSLDPEVAYVEAEDWLRARHEGRQLEWSHPAVREAALSMPYEIRTGSFKANRARWVRALDAGFARV